MKQNENEQTNSNAFPITTMHSIAFPIYNNNNKNVGFKSNSNTSRTEVKIKVYHPKMMIAFRS